MVIREEEEGRRAALHAALNAAFLMFPPLISIISRAKRIERGKGEGETEKKEGTCKFKLPR